MSVLRPCLLGFRRAAAPAVAALFFFRLADRRTVFSVAAVSVLSCKLLHIYVHSLILPCNSLVAWWLSLFAQDIAVLLLQRVMLEPSRLGRAAKQPVRILSTGLASLAAMIQLGLATCNITFFIMIGSEPRWRNVGLVADSSWWAILFTGVWACAATFSSLVFASLVLAGPAYRLTGTALSALWTLSTMLFSKLLSCAGHSNSDFKYAPAAHDEEEQLLEEDKYPQLAPDHSHAAKRQGTRLLRIIGALLTLQAANSVFRPAEQALTFLSWTSLALPVVDYASGDNSPLTDMFPLYNQGIAQKWDRPSTLTEPTRWPWLAKIDDLTAGFSDWYEEDGSHYTPELDPLSHRNFDAELLPSLRGKLGGVDIRNVMIIFLESTRKDVFPLKKDGFVWNKLQDTWSNHRLPDWAQERAANLTATARFLTGDYDDGFQHIWTPRRGGINVQHNIPSATYTWKSLTGGLCGVNPLAADMNQEYRHHIYQPCLPDIFKTFNSLYRAASLSSSPTDGEFVGGSWNNLFMMSVTGEYDHYYELMQRIGYSNEGIFDAKYVKSDQAVFDGSSFDDSRYDGMPETAIEEYIRDAFKTSRNKHSRLFLTHITSSTHFPFGLPKDETYIPFAQEDASVHLQDVSKYINAVGYVDRWIGKILNIIDEEGATDDTLVVLLGDHGAPVIEMGGASPWGVPSVGSFLVPMVFSHPKLPVIDIPQLVSSMSALPTVLDLLIETGSLSPLEQEAARDLLHGYEAPSLLRPLLQPSGDDDNERQWYFTSVSPGGQTISVQSMDAPRWRILVPLIHDSQWGFSDLENDPHEDSPLAALEFAKLLRAIETQHGIEAAKWAEEAAFATRWWVKENHERWHYLSNEERGN